MNCNQVKELLLTDYLDNQLSGKETEEIERHLSACKECHEYAATVKNAPLDPFLGLKRGKPSETVWLKINDAIQQEKQHESEPVPAISDKYGHPDPDDNRNNLEDIGAVARLGDRLKEILSLSKTVYAAISFVLVLIVVFTVLERSGSKIEQSAKVSKEEQVNQLEYMTYLVTDNVGLGEDESGDYGEIIEEFFLSKR